MTKIAVGCYIQYRSHVTKLVDHLGFKWLDHKAVVISELEQLRGQRDFTLICYGSWRPSADIRNYLNVTLLYLEPIDPNAAMVK